jgi:hypothetical protein
MRNIIWHIITAITFGMATLIIGVVIFWTLYPYKTADIDVPIQILNENKQVKIGQPILMKLKVTKYTDITPKGSVYLRCSDNTIIELQASTVNRPPGEYQAIVDKYKVPDKVSAGVKCSFNFRNAYQVNPMREIVKDWYSEEFEVIR